MSDYFNQGTGLLFMKVGTHAREELETIISRKKAEIDEAGYAMWGYGGNSCHPRTMVQPFAESYAAKGQPIVLCMQPMKSNHFADPVRAEQYSIDGVDWRPVPEKINVYGSRYALCIKSLEEVETKLMLSETEVALGNSKGRPGNEYVKGRVDKACLEFAHTSADDSEPIDIGLVANIVKPFAVFLKN